jgi:hypothetical protein
VSERRITASSYRIPAADGSEWTASHTGHLASKEVATGSYCTGGCVSHKAELHAMT